MFSMVGFWHHIAMNILDDGKQLIKVISW